MDDNNNLILGDFGLVFYSDNDKPRVSKTFENVGSRDWMPGWAYGKRVEEVNPTFDVSNKILLRSVLQLHIFTCDASDSALKLNIHSTSL